MNKTAKTAMITALTLCVVGMVLSTAGYFAGGKDSTIVPDMYMYPVEQILQGKILRLWKSSR